MYTNMHTYVYLCKYMYTHTVAADIRGLYIYICIHTHKYIYKYTYIHIYA